MDSSALLALLRDGVPFAGFVDALPTEIAEGRAVAVLEPQPHHLNHVGTVHAGAQFTLAETASGAALLGLLHERFGELVPLAKSATIRYTAPARGTLTATATASVDATAVYAALDESRRTAFDVLVENRDADGTVVSSVTVEWYVSRR